MAHAHLIVVRVVRGRDLDSACAKFRVHVLVCKERNLAVRERQLDGRAEQFTIALVRRVDRHARVAQHRLGARRRHRHAPLSPVTGLDGVLQVVELPCLRRLVHFEVREHSLVGRAPVDDAVAPVDVALLVEAHEDLAHGARQTLVHREALARPVHARALAPHLVQNLPARLVLPLPDALDEFFTAQVVARQPLLLQLAVDHQLRRDARVIHARQPERAVAAHALVPRHHVHQRVLQGVAHVERAGHVRRRDGDGEDWGRRVAVDLWREIAFGLPPRVMLLLGLLGVVSFRNLHRTVFSRQFSVFSKGAL